MADDGVLCSGQEERMRVSGTCEGARHEVQGSEVGECDWVCQEEQVSRLDAAASLLPLGLDGVEWTDLMVVLLLPSVAHSRFWCLLCYLHRSTATNLALVCQRKTTPAIRKLSHFFIRK